VAAAGIHHKKPTAGAPYVAIGRGLFTPDGLFTLLL